MSERPRSSHPSGAPGATLALGSAKPGPFERRAARVLLAAAGPVLPGRPALSQGDRTRVEAEMAVFLARQIFSMPRFLLLPFLLALLAFELLPTAAHGRLFSSLEESRRACIVSGWARSRIAQKRDLVKLIRNCALYFYLDHPLVRAQLELEAGGRPYTDEAARGE